MQALLIATILGYASCGRLDSSYLPPQRSAFGPGSTAFGSSSGAFGSSSGAFGSSSGPFGSASHSFGSGSGSFVRSQPSASAYSGSYSDSANFRSGQQIPILRLDEENNGDGTYRYNYETANGISSQEQGDARGEGTRAQGGFSYTAPDGQQIHIQYTADENGFNAQGPHIPTPPPVPEAILRSIEQNLAEEARGIVNDGQYRPSEAEGQYTSSGASGHFGVTGNFGGARQSYQHQGGYKY